MLFLLLFMGSIYTTNYSIETYVSSNEEEFNSPTLNNKPPTPLGIIIEMHVQ